MNKSDFFKPENKKEKVVKSTSPSGKYQLDINWYVTGKGTWDYTQGTVKIGGKPITVVQRNYRSFWACWYESHPDGHDYLLCGEDYQGQTVIQLDTGKRVDYLPEEAKRGVGFCWVNCEVVDDRVIEVEGCIWGGPFDLIEYDFSDPMSLPYQELERREMVWCEECNRVQGKREKFSSFDYEDDRYTLCDVCTERAKTGEILEIFQ